jgi:hypothetical protein
MHPHFPVLLDTLTTSVAAVLAENQASECSNGLLDPKKDAALRLALLDCKDAVSRFVPTVATVPLSAQ